MPLPSESPPARAPRLPAVLPNNLGPTLLIAMGLLAMPVGVGVPLLLVGLARLRTAHGGAAFPLLATLHEHTLGAWLR